MTKKLPSNQVTKKVIKTSVSTEINGALIGPSSNFDILGTWAGRRDGEVIVAGIDNDNGRLVGMIGSGPGGSIVGLSWVVVTELGWDCILKLALSYTPVGLLGKITSYDHDIRESWITFDGEDLRCLAEAVTLINNHLV